MARKITQDQFRTMPWKNGLGVTTEIFRVARADEMVFRVSSAKVEQSSPFSDFSGFDRTIVNLGPGEMLLKIDEVTEKNLLPMQIFHFDGGASVHCSLSGPCRDLNVFCLRDSYFASTVVRMLNKPEFIPLLASSGWIFFVIKGELCARLPSGREFLISEQEILLHEPGELDSSGRLMLASSSEEPCVFVSISFREK